jgi:predicted phosphodiesterase
MNHENTFKSLGQDMWGANVMIVANEVIGTHLLSRIHNLTQVNIVSGNHDRMTSSNKLDNTGEGGKVLWYMLTKDFPEIVIDYHNSVLTKEIDGINYLLTHGDKGYSKKDFSKFVADYGKSGIYNLIMEGHLHTRKTKKTMAFERKYYQDVEVVSFDDSTYRKLIVPSLFTGNWFSESLGFGGNAGFVISENNGKGCPHVFDYTL